MARPSDYSPELADAICQRLIEGESLRAICRDDGMPSASTLFAWLDKNEDFRSRYARARDIQAELGFDSIQEVAEDIAGDVQRDKLRIETMRWRLSKLLPKKYGDKIEQTHQGPGGGPVMISSVDGDI
jgi:hypothetical protein